MEDASRFAVDRDPEFRMHDQASEDSRYAEFKSFCHLSRPMYYPP